MDDSSTDSASIASSKVIRTSRPSFGTVSSGLNGTKDRSRSEITEKEPLENESDAATACDPEPEAIDPITETQEEVNLGHVAEEPSTQPAAPEKVKKNAETVPNCPPDQLQTQTEESISKDSIPTAAEDLDVIAPSVMKIVLKGKPFHISVAPHDDVKAIAAKVSI